MISSTRATRYPRFEIPTFKISSFDISQRMLQTNYLRLAAPILALTFALGGSLPAFAAKPAAHAAAQTAAAPAARAIGTVESIAANALTLKSDDGKSTSVSIADGARILQIAPGSTSLKSAEVISLTDIAVGDRILVTGLAAAAPAPFQASRIILMKSIDIAKKHAAEAEEWEKHGTGGLVNAIEASAIDPATGTITITARGKKVAVQTTASTIFRRYAGDSVKYEDAKPSVLAQIQPGDQMRVRGQRSDDGMTIQAAEIVSGSFLNLAGTIATLDAATGTLTLKDLATKKTYTVAVTANSNLRYLPPEDARKFAAHQRGAAAAQAGGQAHPASEAAAPHPAASPAATPSSNPSPGAPAMSLSQMLPQLPTATLADLRPGDALMIVASQPSPGSNSLTAVTVLAGVEPILTATPTGQSGPSLSPWNVSGAPDGGGM